MIYPMLSTYYCDPPLLMAIGSIAAESSYLERYMETMLYRLTKIPKPMGQALIETNIMFERKADLLHKVGSAKLARFKKRLATFQPIMAEVKRTNEDRVLAIHGLWLRDFDWDPSRGSLAVQAGPSYAVKRSRKDNGDKILTADRAQQVAKEIHEAHVALHDFAQQTWPRLFGVRMPRVTSPPGDLQLRNTQRDAPPDTSR